ncbi:MAG: beta-ketoacyl-ACP synthase II [Candidatus Aminicenantes bacterium]|nr:beta-ketoacyl-ACP synthase II [Candidatus Aminicenantes bacterium]NIM83386.1 beta-ketoacyl-ACP synthase II [Candidatus Aminicenantes bacterium]NIN22778.1 beta-ketoacyl-ACP synthase II [Candidatus Aminicenantes bacterium]NIN46512.1 beta-ketoacyl-ACP synthase II [Candidatus Aminicenantes bacterium]NIN89417.1 beta-ketoacyl-ACP synthase II [Candidatus Aminicenantes bacterium]
MDFTRRTIQLRRVVVTGMGMISPVGKTISESWESIKNGSSGISKITRFDASNYYVQIAGEIKDYDTYAYFDRKEARKFDPYMQLALIAAEEAVTDSGLNLDRVNKDRAGVFISSGIGGISTIEANKVILLQRGPTRVSPFFLPASLANLASGHVSIKYGFRGANFATVTACAASTHSVGDSFKIIQRGDADIMIAGGAEYPITELGIAGFSVMRALSTRNDEPERASRPFDKERDGFVASEGAAALILEDLEHAVKREARIFAEIVGYGYTSDAYHMTAPDPEASGASRTMQMAINDAQIQPQEVGYINAHGTSTPLNDKVETQAIKQVFGEHAYKLNISSTKSMTGHMLGATGASEAIFSVLSINHSFIPPTINYEHPDEECDLNYTPNKGISKDINYALSNSFGFGGTNGSLLFKKFDGK